MSTTIAKNYQVGSDSTATNNFTIRQPATPDGTVRIANGNSGTTTDLVTVTSAGNVGVGTTPSAWAASNRFIDINASASYGAFGSTDSMMLANAYWNGSNWIRKNANNAWRMVMESTSGAPSWTFQYAGNSTAGSTISWSEAMRITSAGDVGIGTSSPGAKLDVQGGRSYFASNSDAFAAYLRYNNSTAGVFLGSPSANAFQISNSGGGAYLNIDSSGNVGIGTSSPGAKLEIGALGVFRMQTGSTVFNTTPTAGATDTLVWNTSNAGSGFAWNTNSAERVRITPGGDLLVGTTSGLNGSRFYSVTTGNAISGGFKNDTAGYQTIQVWNAAASGTRNLIQFNAGTGGTNVGLVTSDGTNTTYGTSSDYRLKENIQPMIGALEKVAQLKPCIYTWKATGAAGQGFIAHELQNVVPDAVVGEKDAVNEDGSIRPQNIDTSFLVATLAAAIQELKAELDSVKTELALLKGTA